MTRAYEELGSDMADRPRARLEHQAVQRGWGWRSCGAIAGLSGGIIAALMGSLLTAITWFISIGSSYLRTLGTILLFMTIPLLVFGAHCLDLSERRKDR
jgi:hypothetical protein